MSESKPRFIIIARKSAGAQGGARASSNLKSLKAYTCKNHPNKEAYCLCAKCGALLCSNCSMLVGGFRYCESCLIHDDALCEKFEDEVLKPKLNEARPVMAAPQKVSEIPMAIQHVLSDSVAFFQTAKDAPFWLSYLVAFLALIPNAIVQLLFRRETVIPDTEQFKQIATLLDQMDVGTLCLVAVVTTLLQILLLDFIFDICIRGMAKSQLTLKESATTFHFCLLPLFFSVLGAWFEQPMISFIALGLMLILTTTATRVVTKCTLWRGMVTMFVFIFITTIVGIL